ncbi:hypothetical protein CBL_02877 [Carabus blaptoides fortunei]
MSKSQPATMHVHRQRRLKDGLSVYKDEWKQNENFKDWLAREDQYTGRCNWCRTTFSVKYEVTKSQEASVAASFAVCLEIEKAKKPFSDGELILKCAIKMAHAFNDNEMARKFETVSLSHQTVSRLVDEITLDDSTDISDTSQMLIFIRTVNENYSYSEEHLQLRSLHGTTKGEDIYKELKCAIAQYGGFDKCTAIVTDGARAMTGKNIGLAGILQKEGINCRMLHCIVHQEALCGLSLKLRYVMDKADPFIASSGATGIQMFKLLDKEKCPKMRDFGLQIISMFGSTYICERALSGMKYIKSKYRNSLKDSTLENIIRLATTNIDMDIKEIVAQQLRPQNTVIF